MAQLTLTLKYTEITNRFAGHCAEIPGVNFFNVLRAAFAHADPKSVKNTVKSALSFYAFGLHDRKSCI